MEKKLFDTELGTITLRSGSRYTRYALKVANGAIVATMPERGDEHKLLRFIEEKRERLRAALLKHPAKAILDEHTELQMATFRLRIIREERTNIRTVLKEGLLTVACPVSVDIAAGRIQLLLQEILTNVSRHEAKRVLPPRLMQLARQHGFTCTGVKINNSKTHWGSCTARKSINLSLGLMKLPWHLIDYVLLHELCHTVEMNHSDRFWEQMDRVTGGQSKSLRAALRQYCLK